MGGKGQRDEREDREATLRGGDAELKGSAGRTRRIRSQWMRLMERGAGRRGEEREDVMSWNQAGQKIKVNKKNKNKSPRGLLLVRRELAQSMYRYAKTQNMNKYGIKITAGGYSAIIIITLFLL